MQKTIGYRRTYKLRKLIPNRRYVSVGLPFEVIEREAANLGITPDQFIAQHIAVAEYDGFDGVRYTFRECEAVG